MAVFERAETVPNKYTHYWTTEKFHLGGSVAQQTKKLLEDYQEWLQAKGCTMKDHCLRTWFFISDIDTNYPAFAKTRTDYFRELGMDETTHYLASTGIEGANGAPGSYVTMDAYAVSGLEPSQITYLQATTHLIPAKTYGVTSERGVALQFEDRRHIFISGTASIDAAGNIVEPGNIRGQTLRMWENVEVLLAQADATWQDVAQIIVYLRRQEDLPLVRALFTSRFRTYLPLLSWEKYAVRLAYRNGMYGNFAKAEWKRMICCWLSCGKPPLHL